MHVKYGFQLECRPCKKFVVNAPLNPLRNPTQHREDSLRRRALEVLADSLLERKWIYFAHRIRERTEFDLYIWEKFGKKCFKCEISLPELGDMALDHTMPLSFLWPLDDTATCLCTTCNSAKRDKFPVDFYGPDQLERLGTVTGLPMRDLRSRSTNETAVTLLRKRVAWFFDDFLAQEEYQKEEDGKRAADLVLKALVRALKASKNGFDPVKEYEKKTGRKPHTVTL